MHIEIPLLVFLPPPPLLAVSRLIMHLVQPVSVTLCVVKTFFINSSPFIPNPATPVVMCRDGDFLGGSGVVLQRKWRQTPGSAVVFDVLLKSYPAPTSTSTHHHHQPPTPPHPTSTPSWLELLLIILSVRQHTHMLCRHGHTTTTRIDCATKQTNK